MKKFNLLIALLFTCMLSMNFVYADDPTLAPGQVTPDQSDSEPPGVVTNDDGMQPDANPLAPAMPLTPSTYFPQPQPATTTTLPSTDDTTTTQPPETTEPSAPTSSQQYVPGPASGPQNNPMMEKCHILDKDGNGLIKAYMADSGPTLEGDPNAWIWVPYGQCKKLNQGDYSGVSDAVRGKINPSNVTNAQTIQ